MSTFNTTATNNEVHFTFNHLNKTIVGTRLNFERSGNPDSPLYNELMKRMAQQPTYTFEVIERKKNKEKKTYEGLTYDLMIDYLDALADQTGIDDPEKSMNIQEFRQSLAQMKTDGVPFGRRKKVFLEKYPDFSVNKAKELVKRNNFQALKVHYNIIRLGKPETGVISVPLNKKAANQ